MSLLRICTSRDLPEGVLASTPSGVGPEDHATVADGSSTQGTTSEDILSYHSASASIERGPSSRCKLSWRIRPPPNPGSTIESSGNSPSSSGGGGTILNGLPPSFLSDIAAMPDISSSSIGPPLRYETSSDAGVTIVGSVSHRSKSYESADDPFRLATEHDTESSLSFRPSMAGSSVSGITSSSYRMSAPLHNFESEVGATSSLSLDSSVTNIPNPMTAKMVTENEKVVISEEETSKTYEASPINDQGGDLAHLPPIISHEPHSYLTVGRRLLESSMMEIPPQNTPLGADTNRRNPQGPEWWKNFSESDWEAMSQVAREALETLGDDEIALLNEEMDSPSWFKSLPPIPPQPPMETSIRSGDLNVIHLNAKVAAVISSILPKEFLCPLCDRTIVGAAVSGCRCNQLIFCTPCLLKKSPGTAENLAKCGERDAGDIIVDGFVFVKSKPETVHGEDMSTGGSIRQCPSCLKPLEQPFILCHALDVAILKSVSDLSPVDYEESVGRIAVESIKADYFSRLDWWRNEILRERNIFNEKFLGLLIQMEEEKIWRCRKNKTQSLHGNPPCRQKRFGISFLREAAVLLAVAAVAAVFGAKGSVRR